jgi:SAM-dependent methyltransferase
MKKKLIKRIAFFLSHPNDSIINRIKYYIYKKRGIDFKAEFDLSKLGLRPENSNIYESMEGIRRLKLLFKSLNISKKDSIIDLGCGKGEAIVQLAKYPFNEVAGVELSEKLYLICQNNLRIFKKTDIKLYHDDAGNFGDIDRFNFIYMFNPFPEIVMQKVVLNIEHSLQRKPRLITVIYSHPTCHDVLDSSDIIKKTNEFEIKYKERKLKVFVYKSIGT